MTDGAKAQWRAWMDRKPNKVHAWCPVYGNDACPHGLACGGAVCIGVSRGETCDTPVTSTWRDWFDGDTCLAVMSSRTGPDVPTVAAKKCDCSQCNPNGGE